MLANMARQQAAIDIETAANRRSGDDCDGFAAIEITRVLSLRWRNRRSKSNYSHQACLFHAALPVWTTVSPSLQG